MRLFAALFVLVTISLTVACTKRDAIEKANQLDQKNLDGIYEATDAAATPDLPVAAVNAPARVNQMPATTQDQQAAQKAAQQAQKAQAAAQQVAAAAANAYESLSYSNFEVKNDHLIFRRMSTESLTFENEVLGDIKDGKGAAKELLANEPPQEGDRPAKKFDNIFRKDAQIRILKNTKDGSLTISAKRPNQAVVSLVLKRVDEKAAGEKANAVSKAIQSITAKKKDILAKIGGQELQLKTVVEVVTPKTGDKKETVTKNEDLQDERQSGQNTIVNFRKVKVTVTDDKAYLLVNGKRQGRIGFHLLKAVKDGEQKLVTQMVLDNVEKTVSRKGPFGEMDLSQANLLIVKEARVEQDGSKTEITYTYQYAVQNGPVDQKAQPVVVAPAAGDQKAQPVVAAPAADQKTQPAPTEEVVKPKEGVVAPVAAPAPTLIEN